MKLDQIKSNPARNAAYTLVEVVMAVFILAIIDFALRRVFGRVRGCSVGP